MTAYVVAGNDVTDIESMEKYVAAAGPTLARHGGRLLAPNFSQLAAGGEVIHKEGDFKPSRVVIIEFPDMEKAQAWYNSPEYQGVKHFRLAGSVGSLFIANGITE